ncbi:MAG: peptidylprolyl isomerase [Pseudomonadales bacterium]
MTVPHLSAAALRAFATALLAVGLAGASVCAAAAAADPSVTAADHPRVRLVTSLGNIDVELFADRAPQTVANFLRLVDDGFYDGLVFHRVVAGFVIQAGGYDAAMNYREPPGTVVNESANGMRNVTGTLAMARLSDPDSADAQFFINVDDNAHLDPTGGTPGYTVFGRVSDGMDVVTEIELSDTGRQAGMAGVPDTPIVIVSTERL